MGMDLRKLQNGSDIRGIAVDGVAGEKVNLTDSTVFCLPRHLLFGWDSAPKCH